MKPHMLKNIKLDEISLVDVPANSEAKITLFKRGEPMKEEDMSDAMKAKMKEYMDKGYSKEDAMKMCMGEKTMKGGQDMDPQELAEKLEALEGQVEDLTKRAEGAEAELDGFKKAADEAGFDVDEEGKLTKRADPEYIEVDGERFEKAAVPATILKALEAKEAELAKAKAEQEEVALAKRGAEELPHLAGTDVAKGKLLAAVDGDEDVLKALKAADAALKKQMEEIGANPLNDEASATFRLNKMAEDYAKQHNVPFETGYAKVTESGEGRELMHESRAEAN
jgi:hypothetical protein